MYEVVIVGGGPGGLAAALTLGRARKRVLLCDAGPRRNALATHIHNFVTRDGTPPDEFRRIAREQLAAYPTVEIVDERVTAIAGERNAFRLEVGARSVEARRILLATGLVDTPLEIAGFQELWGHSIFQCPYCHGYEVRDRKWGFLALQATVSHALPFAMLIRSWTDHVTVFTNQSCDLDNEVRARLDAAGLQLECSPIKRLVADGVQLTGVELGSGKVVPCDVLFTQPAQTQVPVVQALNLALDEHGCVVVDPQLRETSTKGIYASGDLTTRMHAAIQAAASGMQTAAMINVDLAMD